VPSYSDLRAIPGFMPADVHHLLGGTQHVQHALEEDVQLQYWRVADISSEAQQAWQVYCCAFSTTTAGQQYLVRCGVAWDQRRGFFFLDMPLQRKKPIARCSCEAGERSRSSPASVISTLTSFLFYPACLENTHHPLKRF